MGGTSYLLEGRNGYRFTPVSFYDRAGIYYYVCYMTTENSLQPDITR